jgi:LAO/AO transport system kinase
MLSGAGDELQGIKRGIMEMSDLIAITKADGSNIDKATLAKALYSNALHLFPPTDSGWVPSALTSSAVTKEGLEEILSKILDYFKLTESNGYYLHKRMEQSRFWMYETINEALKNRFFEDPLIQEKLLVYEKKVLDGKIGSFTAASELLNLYNKK